MEAEPCFPLFWEFWHIILPLKAMRPNMIFLLIHWAKPLSIHLGGTYQTWPKLQYQIVLPHGSGHLNSLSLSYKRPCLWQTNQQLGTIMVLIVDEALNHNCLFYLVWYSSLINGCRKVFGICINHDYIPTLQNLIHYYLHYHSRAQYYSGNNYNWNKIKENITVLGGWNFFWLDWISNRWIQRWNSTHPTHGEYVGEHSA